MAKKESPENPISFEQAVSELEAIVETMEQGEIALEEALSRYQRGVGLIRHCQGILDVAEQRVRLLEQGQLQDLHDSAQESGS